MSLKSKLSLSRNKQTSGKKWNPNDVRRFSQGPFINRISIASSTVCGLFPVYAETIWSESLFAKSFVCSYVSRYPLILARFVFFKLRMKELPTLMWRFFSPTRKYLLFDEITIGKQISYFEISLCAENETIIEDNRKDFSTRENCLAPETS